MKFKIINNINNDYFVIEGNELNELRKNTIVNCIIRGWTDCHSEIVK